MNTQHMVSRETKQAAISAIQAGTYSCILIQGDTFVYKGEGIGVSPLRKLYESEQGRQNMHGALLVDKVIGKAAAVLAVLGQVEAVYGEITSRVAFAYLEENGIRCEYGTLVECIQNRTKDGLCPVEQSVLHEENAQKAYNAMVHTIQTLMAKK